MHSYCPQHKTCWDQDCLLRLWPLSAVVVWSLSEPRRQVQRQAREFLPPLGLSQGKQCKPVGWSTRKRDAQQAWSSSNPGRGQMVHGKWLLGARRRTIYCPQHFSCEKTTERSYQSITAGLGLLQLFFRIYLYAQDHGGLFEIDDYAHPETLPALSTKVYYRLLTL